MRDPERILIVDDEDAILFAMRDYFTLRGYEVDAARDLEEATERLDTHAYAIVIVDLCLSEMPCAEGLDMAAYVQESYPATPVILFTAYLSRDVEAKAGRCGVCLVLKKPQPLTEVERWVRAIADECGHRSGSAAS